MRKGNVVKMQLTQPHHGPDGEVLHQPGELFDESDALVAELPEGSFKPVVVDQADVEAAEKADAEVASGDTGAKQSAGARKGATIPS